MRLLALVLTLLAASTARADFFDTPRHGTNFFNAVETRERFHAAAAQGIRLVRLAPDKWKGTGRDFLLGNADRFQGIPPADLARLRRTLDDAQAEGVQVVLTLLSLPGARWRQHNGDRSDFRLYREAKYRDQAVALWRELATALKGHPAIAGYNLVNEPHPDRAPDTANFDLSAFYRRVVAAIREVDPAVPIVLDGAEFASPRALARLVPIDDPHVLYAFHFYEPWPYVDHKSRGKYRYPGQIPLEEGRPETEPWDAAAMERAVQPVVEWQAKYHVPSTRIFAAEFGCPRTNPGVETWMGDLVRLFDAHGWHWAFYSFREDTWDAMDYELGPERPPWTYWQDLEAGKNPRLPRKANATWDVLRRAFAEDVASGGN